MRKITGLLSRFAPLLFVFLTLILFGFFSIHNADVPPDGLMLKPVIDVSRGYILFRDMFTQYGTLTTCLQALSISVFGE